MPSLRASLFPLDPGTQAHRTPNSYGIATRKGYMKDTARKL